MQRCEIKDKGAHAVKMRAEAEDAVASERGTCGKTEKGGKYGVASIEMLKIPRKQTKQRFTVYVLWLLFVSITSVRNYVIPKCHTAFISPATAVEKLPL